MSYTFRCPALDCGYTASHFSELKGHVDGKRPYCTDHAALPPLKKWHFKD